MLVELYGVLCLLYIVEFMGSNNWIDVCVVVIDGECVMFVGDGW